MATFEHWLLRMLKALILSNPREFYPNSKKQIEVTYLKKFHDMPMLWEEPADAYLNALSYEGMKPMLTTFLSRFGFEESDFTKNLLDAINENSQCRNLIIHNQKKVTATYIKKSGRFGKYSEGEDIVITEDILFEQADNLLRFMQDFRANHATQK